MKQFLFAFVSLILLTQHAFANDLICTQGRPGQFNYEKMVVSETANGQVLITRFIGEDSSFQTFRGKKLFDHTRDTVATQYDTVPNMNQGYSFGYIHELRYYTARPSEDLPEGDDGHNYGFNGGIGVLVYEYRSSDQKQKLAIRIYSLEHRFWLDDFGCGQR